MNNIVYVKIIISPRIFKFIILNLNFKKRFDTIQKVLYNHQFEQWKIFIFQQDNSKYLMIMRDVF